MHPDSTHSSPDVVPGSQGLSPMDAADAPIMTLHSRVRARGVGRGQVRDSHATTGGQPIPERPNRAKKNHRPAQVVFDHTIQRRTSEQVKADQVKANAEAAAAEAAAIADKECQLQRVASIEDAMQAEDDAKSLEDLRPDLHIGPKSVSNSEVDTLSDSHLIPDDAIENLHDSLMDFPPELSSYRDLSHSEEFLTDWQETQENTTVVEENNKDEDDGLGYIMLSENESDHDDETRTRKRQPAPKAKFKPQPSKRGTFRAAVNDARQVPPPPPSQVKKRKAPEPQPPVDSSTGTKRTKASEPRGLVPNWKPSVRPGLLSHIAHKHPVEFVDDEDDSVKGEFDRAEGPDMLSAVRASKPSTVRIDSKASQVGVKFTSRPTSRNPNSGRPKQNRAIVDDLPFPHPRAVYNARWQKQFRPTLLSWASTFPDAYATNTLLDDTIVLEMWDIIYPDVVLDEEERQDTGVKLVYLAGNILNDWRTAIGTGALAVVKSHFLLPANRDHFSKERITKFVRWGLDPKKFNFIYGAPSAEANQKQGFRSELILNVYAIHLKKVVGAAAIYGEQIGALALCTAATERALTFWASGDDMSLKTDENGRRKLTALFGETEWGPKARGWSQSTCRLSAEQWKVITAEATIRGKKLPQDDANGEETGEVDPRALLEL